MAHHHLSPDLPQTLFGMTSADHAGTLLFFPDFGGNTIYARPLVKQLGAQISCFAVRFSAEMIRELGGLSIEDVGERFAQDIQRAAFKRPLHFVGFSFAAALAFETARALTVQGASPDNVWILDLPAPTPLRIRDVMRRPLFHLRLTYRQLRQNWRSVLFRQHDPMILQRYGVIGFDLRDHPDSYRFIIRHLYMAYGRYRAQPGTSLITVLRASGNRSRRAVPDDLGWQKFSTGVVKSHLVPGDHLGMLRVAENAAVIADLISANFAGQTISESDDKYFG